MSELLLGIDGGGSKTLLCLADRSGAIVHVARAGGSNPIDNPRWRDAFSELARSIAPFRSRIAAASLAVGGYHESAAVDREVDAALPALFGLPLDLENDVFVAHDAAFLGGEGVLLIAGTGSMAVMRGPDGRLGRVGGWGDLFGDEGSAHWIGREALSLAARSHDGRLEAAGFSRTMFSAVVGPGADPTTIFDWIAALEHPRSEIAALSRVVAGLAADRDAAALRLLEQAAALLAEHVDAGRRRAGLGPAGRWSLLGGLGQNPVIRQVLEDRLGPMQPPALPPCGGALWRAARNAGWSIDQGWLANIRAGIETASATPPTIMEPMT